MLLSSAWADFQQPTLAQKTVHLSDAEYNKAVLVYKNLNQIDKLIKEKRNVDARLYLEKLVRYDPNPYSAEVHGLLAETCYRLGNDEEAIKHYQIAIQLNPKDITSHWNIALCFMHLSNYDSAAAWAQKLLKLNPNPQLKAQAQRFIEEMGEKKAEAAGTTFNTTNFGGSQFPGTAPSQSNTDYLAELAAKGDAHRWPAAKMPLKIYVEDPRAVTNFRPQFIQLFFDALTAWSNASRNKIAFVSARFPEEADLILSFTCHPEDIAQKPGEPPIEQGIARTLVVREEGSRFGTIEKAKIQVLVVHPSNGLACTDEEIKETCLHEIGHALGLNGHSPGASDIMHFVQSFRQLPALTKRDRNTIAALYSDYPTLTQNASNNYSPAPHASSFDRQPVFSPYPENYSNR